MITVKFNGINADYLKTGFSQIKQANELESQARKLKESGKAIIESILRTERKIEIERLPVAEMVSIDSIGLIEIGKQNRFDSKAFQLAEPVLFAEYTKEFSIVKFKALV